MKNLLLFVALMATTLLCFSQAKIKVEYEGVTINNTSQSQADSSAVLDINSHNKGILFPRLTSDERNAINNPADGLLIYNTTKKNYEFFNGTAWRGLVLLPEEPGTGGTTPPDSTLIANGYEGILASGIGLNTKATDSERLNMPDINMSGDFSLIVRAQFGAVIGNYNDQLHIVYPLSSTRTQMKLGSGTTYTFDYAAVANGWHDYGVKRNGSDLTLYIDGSEVETKNNVSMTTLTINSIGTQGTGYWDTDVQEIIFSSEVWTDSQFLHWTNNPQEALPDGGALRSNLIAHYKFPDNISNNGPVFDISGQGKHASFLSTATQPSNAAEIGLTGGYQTALGQFNRYPKFSSSEYADLGSGNELRPTGNWTFKALYYAPKNVLSAICGDITGTYMRFTTTSADHLIIALDGSLGSTTITTPSGARGLHELKVNYDGTTIKVFIDGGEVASKIFSLGSMDRFIRYLGRYAAGNNDQVTIYWAEYYDDATETNLVSRWEGQKDFVDNEGNNHMSIVGSPEYENVYGQDHNSSTDIFGNNFQYEWKEGMLNFVGGSHEGINAGSTFDNTGDVSSVFGIYLPVGSTHNVLAASDRLGNTGFVFRITGGVHLAYTAASGSTYNANSAIEYDKWMFYAFTRTAAGVLNFYKRDENGAFTLVGTPDQATGTPVNSTSDLIIGQYGEERLIPPVLAKKILSISEMDQIADYWTDNIINP